MDIQLNEEQRKKLKDAVLEAVKSKYRSEDESSFRKDVSDRMNKELGIPKKTFNSLVLRAYKNDADKLNDEITELLDLAEELGFYTHNKDS